MRVARVVGVFTIVPVLNWQPNIAQGGISGPSRSRPSSQSISSSSMSSSSSSTFSVSLSLLLSLLFLSRSRPSALGVCANVAVPLFISSQHMQTRPPLIMQIKLLGGLLPARRRCEISWQHGSSASSSVLLHYSTHQIRPTSSSRCSPSCLVFNPSGLEIGTYRSF